MLIACVQSDVSFGDADANLSRVLEWMEIAGAIPADVAANAGLRGLDETLSAKPARTLSADLIVFPECMLTGYAFDDRDQAMAAALSIDDPRFGQIAASASRRRQWVTIGFAEKANDRLFNSAVLIGPEGVVGHYRKVHLPHLGIDRFVERGDIPYQSFAADTPEGALNVGLAICYDGSFPEPMRVLGLCGADVIALGTNWPTDANQAAEIIPPARSMENHLYFVAANRIGEENGFGFGGRSSICGPDGITLVRSAGDEPCLLWAEVDLERVRNKRIVRTEGAHMIDRFADRRPEFYGKIVER